MKWIINPFEEDFIKHFPEAIDIKVVNESSIDFYPEERFSKPLIIIIIVLGVVLAN